MFELEPFVYALAALLALATLAWAVSVAKRDVSIVDTVWSLMFVLAAFTYAATVSTPGARTSLVLALVSLWGLRLAGYITWRNWGEGEDRRYRAIRARNEPRFAFKSLYLVFWLQAGLAWVISLPLLAAVAAPAPLALLDYVGVALWLVGLAFESVGDLQLARFKRDPANRGKVMDRGLWRYTRHPNYFGDFCIWWGFYLIALSAGGWWSVVSPVVMSVLLLKVSGVTLLEQDIGERRPGYDDYAARTNAFFPGPVRERRARGEAMR